MKAETGEERSGSFFSIKVLTSDKSFVLSLSSTMLAAIALIGGIAAYSYTRSIVIRPIADVTRLGPLNISPDALNTRPISEISREISREGKTPDRYFVVTFRGYEASLFAACSKTSGGQPNDWQTWKVVVNTPGDGDLTIAEPVDPEMCSKVTKNKDKYINFYAVFDNEVPGTKKVYYVPTKAPDAKPLRPSPPAS